MNTGEESKPSISNPHKSRLATELLWWLGGLVLLVVVSFLLLMWSARPKPPIQVALADGRILQIEGVTYGTKHRIGQPAVFLDRFRPWLPRKMKQVLDPKHPQSNFTLDRPGLVVWVNALDPETGTNVDCQGIRTEFVDQYGEVFGEQTSSWFGGQSFWRVGHIFYAYPREERQLNFQVTPWRTNRANNVKLPNPNFCRPAKWSGGPLPQVKKVDGLEVVLNGLTVRTNGGKKKNWEAPARYWEPAWEFRRDGKAVGGWSEPEWVAEDPLGNRGQFLGIHQSVLRFIATVYPEATNTLAAETVASLPPIDLGQLSTNIWWNKTCQAGSNSVVILGVCPPGVHVFSGGEYDTNSPAGMSAVRGGARSGWVGRSKRINPLQLKHQDGHYTPDPTIYIRTAELRESGRLAVGLKDSQGLYWAVTPESQGAPQGIHPFLLRLPPQITNVVAEVALLRPVQAEFMVDTRGIKNDP